MSEERYPAGERSAAGHSSEVVEERAIRSSIRVLHLEDDPRDAELIARVLNSEDPACEIVRADSRGTFEARLSDRTFDLVICDFNLPHMDGLTALRLAKSRLPEAPVIIVSGAIDPTEAVQCLKEGAADYVLKERLERLPSAVTRALSEAALRQRQREMEAQLFESELRFRQLAEHSREGFWFAALNPERILYVNRAVETIWDRPSREFYEDPRAWLKAIHEDDRARLRDLWETWIQGEAPLFEEEYRLVRPDGSVRWVVHSGTRIRPSIGSDARLSGLMHDVTERKLLEARLVQAQRMESIGRLAGGIAHDFNNLLTVINGMTDLALTGLDEVDPLRTDLGEVLRAGERAAALTQQLLAFSRNQVLQPRVLSLPTVLANTERLLRRVLGEPIELAVKLPEQLGNVKADPSQLEQVLVNLAVVARDAMPQGGLLTIEARGVQLGEGDRHPEVALPSGPYVMLAVSDTGDGMDDATQRRIFEPFAASDDVEQGKGLGLSMVHGVIVQSGGSISVESEVGRGTTFRIYLPEVSEAVQAVPIRCELPAPGFQTILLVDDNDGLRKLARRMLLSAGYSVLAAADGAQALGLLERSTQPVHLLLTDVVMPGMHGDELARRARAILPDIRVLYATGYTNSTLLCRGVLDPRDSFVGKPFTATDLTRKVRQVLNM